jgi:rhamnogalacturonan endolyase
MRFKAILFGLSVLSLTAWISPIRAAVPDTPAAIRQTSDAYILENGLISATISKTTGEILSLKSNGQELLAPPGSVAPGSWSNSLAGAAVTSRILIDPAANYGNSCEVSIRADTPLVIDMRYSLARRDPVLYVCQILDHPANLPSARVASGGFQLRLNPDVFDVLTAGKNRSHGFPLPQDWMSGQPVLSNHVRRIVSGDFAKKVICDWDDSALQMETPVYGYSNAKSGAGLWLINPSSDYLSRGGNVEAPTGWHDTVDGVPTLVNRWGGEPLPLAGFTVDRGEAWSHVIGPFLLYCNQRGFRDAEARAKVENSRWPYTWAFPDECLPVDQRGTVTGRIVLNQSPLASVAFPTSPPMQNQNATILQMRYGGQTTSDIPTTQPQMITQLHGAMIGLSSDQDWQTNFFDNQRWIRANDDGTFSFKNVLPGDYMLHVYCDGQMGEATLPSFRVSPGQNVNIGKVVWAPPVYGNFVWQLGYPDRSAAEFRHGHDASRWGLWTLDPREFPKGMDYFIGKSNPQTDWNFAQAAGTTWTIHFPLGFVPYGGFGVLQISLAGGSGQAGLRVSINGNDISGALRVTNPPMSRQPGALLVDDIAHDQVSGVSRVNLYGFPLQSVRLGDNVLRLRVSGSKPTDGIMYDALRMEIYANSAQMGTQGQPDDPQVPGLERGHSGFDFGQKYQGDQSGNYTALSRVPNGTAP